MQQHSLYDDYIYISTSLFKDENDRKMLEHIWKQTSYFTKLEFVKDTKHNMDNLYLIYLTQKHQYPDRFKQMIYDYYEKDIDKLYKLLNIWAKSNKTGIDLQGRPVFQEYSGYNIERVNVELLTIH